MVGWNDLGTSKIKLLCLKLGSLSSLESPYCQHFYNNLIQSVRVGTGRMLYIELMHGLWLDNEHI